MTGLRARTDNALNDAERLWVDVLSGVTPDMREAPTLCGDWTVADLINHVAGGGERYSMLLAGRSADDTATTRDNDYIGDDPVALFWTYENAFRSAASIADLTAHVDHRAGTRTGHNLVDLRIMDLTLHAHDLSETAGVRWQPTDALVRYLLDEIPPTITELRQLGLFGPAIVTTAADPADLLLALAGRVPVTDSPH